MNHPAVVLQHVRSSRRMRWPVPAVAGAGRTGDYEVVQDIRGLVSRSGKGPAALTRWNRGTGEQGNNRIKARTLQLGRLSLGLYNGRETE